MATELVDPLPPDPAYVRQRWISPHKIAWAQRADKILMECGAVVGDRSYDTYTRARYGARRLRDTMIALNMHEPWQLREHVNPGPDGWTWALEYVNTPRR